MAAEMLSASGHAVTVYDGMPTFGRKFLLAGKSGLNITHSEDYQQFAARFGAASDRLRAALDAFTPADVRAWASGLGTENLHRHIRTRVSNRHESLAAFARLAEAAGSAGRNIDATPVAGRDFPEPILTFETQNGAKTIQSDATLSRPRRRQLAVPGRPTAAGFHCCRTRALISRASSPPIAASTSIGAISSGNGSLARRSNPSRPPRDAGTFPGEFVISRHGIEGSLVYAHSAALRDNLNREGHAALTVDLAPGRQP